MTIRETRSGSVRSVSTRRADRLHPFSHVLSLQISFPPSLAPLLLVYLVPRRLPFSSRSPLLANTGSSPPRPTTMKLQTSRTASRGDSTGNSAQKITENGRVKAKFAREDPAAGKSLSKRRSKCAGVCFDAKLPSADFARQKRISYRRFWG